MAVPEPAVKVTPVGRAPLSVIAGDGVPLARTVKEKADPDLTVSDVALVKDGADEAPTVKVKDCMTVPDELVAVMRMLSPPALVAAVGVPAMVAAYLAGMVQEHERGLGGWYAEWPTVAGIVEGLGVAMASMAEAAEGLKLDTARMRANLDATRGAVFAEKALMLMAPTQGREEAHKMIEEAVRESQAEGRRLQDVLGLEGLETPEAYLGSAEEFRKRLLDWHS